MSRKSATAPIQSVVMETIFLSLGKDGKPLTDTEPLYGDQGLINAGDFNFDGHEDFAVLSNFTLIYWPTFTPPQWPRFTPPLTQFPCLP